MQSISPADVRRIVLHAQGFGRRPESEPDSARLRALVRRLGAVQIDSVNVLVRTHYLPAFSRLGSYSRERLEAEAWGSRRSLFEYWGHEASWLPVELQPLLRWRMARAMEGREIWEGVARFGRERKDFIAQVFREIERRGPVTGADFAEGPRGASGWWAWTDGKRALEWLFWAGLITTRTRRGFERVYDLTERTLPQRIVDAPTPDPATAQRELVRLAAHALGIATASDLRDYFRLTLGDARARLAELVEDGELLPVEVPGWAKPAFLSSRSGRARKIRADALLSPFDNLIWNRDRTERIFDVRVRLEIYTPAHKRVHGYYVLPFLQDEGITARVDLKADRKANLLRVQAAWRERGATSETPDRLAAELRKMAEWLGLQDVEVASRGDLASDLQALI